MREPIILDASAFLAVLFREEGADQVLRNMSQAIMSAVNETEVLTKAYRKSNAPEEARGHIDSFGVEIIPYTQEHSQQAALLQSQTEAFGLSLADRACLALAMERKLPVLTGDRAWSQLDIGAHIHMIR